MVEIYIPFTVMTSVCIWHIRQKCDAGHESVISETGQWHQPAMNQPKRSEQCSVHK